MWNVLAISGSLRARSSNTELLRAVALLAPASTRVTIYEGLGALPHFNPDLDLDGSVPPEPVRVLRAAVAAADAILISSPEYAHGVPGALKNALDWLVSGTEILNKPIGLLNASQHSTYAHPALAETLRTMTAVIVDGASLTIPLSGRKLDAAAIAADAELSQLLVIALRALAAPASHTSFEL